MSNCPETVREFQAWFPDDESCRPYLERIRRPNGPHRLRCSQEAVWTMKAPFYRCTACRHDFTVTAGTLFGDSRLPLTLWFEAMWYAVNQKHGASALGGQRVLGVSYPTAWRWLHKLRRTMVRPGRNRLTSTVEMDEVYIGGERPGKRGRARPARLWSWWLRKPMAPPIERTRLGRVANTSQSVLTLAVGKVVEPNARVLTDDWDR